MRGRPRSRPYIYKRKGRDQFYAFLDSKRKNISLGTEDEAEALKRLAQLVEDNGITIPKENRERYTLADFFALAAQEADATLKESSHYDFVNDLHRFLVWRDEHKPGLLYPYQITAEIVKEFVTFRRSKEVSPARINRELSALRRAQKTAVSKGLIPPRALEAFEGQRLKEYKHNAQIKLLTKDEVYRFLWTAVIFERKYFPLFFLALGTGFRDDELRHLDMSDIGDTTISVTKKELGFCACCKKRGWTPKNHESRTNPASDSCVWAAKTYMELKASGVGYSYGGVSKALKRVSKRAGIKRITMHDFRRLYASYLQDSGIHIHKISRLLGHSDVTVTLRYLRIVSDLPKANELPF